MTVARMIIKVVFVLSYEVLGAVSGVNTVPSELNV